jgi:hypothetical protein
MGVEVAVLGGLKQDWVPLQVRLAGRLEVVTTATQEI